MADFENLGKALTLVREIRGLSQAEVARRSRTGKSQLSKYENGKELPKLDTLAAILKALNIGVFQFWYVVHLVDMAAIHLNLIEEMRAQRLPPPPMSGEGFLSNDTDAAFRRLMDDLVHVYLQIQWERLGVTGGAG